MIDTKLGKLPVYFGMNALAQYGDITDKTMTQVMESLADMSKLKMSELITFIYCGLSQGARKEKAECLVKSVEEVGDMIDDDPDLITKVMSAYSEQSTPEDAEPGDGKKK